MKNELVSLLQDLFQRNASTPTSLSGGAFCASIERADDGEPWVQAKNGVLNIFFPSDNEPIQTLRDSVPTMPNEATCPDWEPWKFATIVFPELRAVEMAELITDLFVHFYGFPDDTPVRTEIIDMR